MQQKITVPLNPAESANPAAIRYAISQATGQAPASVTGYTVLKKSVDARSRNIKIILTLNAFINEPYHVPETTPVTFRDVHAAPHQVVIIGAGPAGLFAALQLIEQGIKPIVLERGKDVRARRRDLAQLNRSGVINPESNYCFGEGGAGTYSDGKLYTRSNKRGSIDSVLNLFVQFGAEEKILYESHPHIGTNKLPEIITAMREQIRTCGGEVHFNSKVVDFIWREKSMRAVKTADGASIEANAFILATGHSARDIFELLLQKNILIEAKPFALGVRIEHPQDLIDTIQYCHTLPSSLKEKYVRPNELEPAAYSLVQQVEGRGVFSFCMCPGGIIAAAATAPGEIVVNGWSPSKRNNPYANSGMVVQIEKEDILHGKKHADPNDPLLFLNFQKEVEQQCYRMGGGNLVAPAQRMTDFCDGKISTTLPECSYHPGLNSVSLKEALPGFVYQSLAQGFRAFGKKLKGYYTRDAVVVATESRTSSPVRIPRDDESLAHPQFNNFYPCGEGAGYAGGIVSAAMDGQKVAHQIAHALSGIE